MKTNSESNSLLNIIPCCRDETTSGRERERNNTANQIKGWLIKFVNIDANKWKRTYQKQWAKRKIGLRTKSRKANFMLMMTRERKRKKEWNRSVIMLMLMVKAFRNRICLCDCINDRLEFWMNLQFFFVRYNRWDGKKRRRRTIVWRKFITKGMRGKHRHGTYVHVHWQICPFSSLLCVELEKLLINKCIEEFSNLCDFAVAKY